MTRCVTEGGYVTNCKSVMSFSVPCGIRRVNALQGGIDEPVLAGPLRLVLVLAIVLEDLLWVIVAFRGDHSTNAAHFV